jgi:hypothetical protein
MKLRLPHRLASLLTYCVGFTVTAAAAHAAVHDVYTSPDFTALPTLPAGDTVLVHNGVYPNVTVTLTGNGTAANPVIIYAETNGGVAFSGVTAVTIAGSYVTFAGFKFDGDTAAGGSPGTNKSSILQLASGSNHCTVTNCMIRNFDANAVPGNTYYWFMVRGYTHTIEYNSIEGKTTAGASIVYDMPEGAATMSTPRNHLFHFNYMGPRTIIGSNGYEGIRVGVSTEQDYNSASIFEYNYFYRTIYGAGEPEAISNKSSNNIYRYNTFQEVRGQLSLRHGDGCLVEGNFFFGANLSDAGGVRVIGQNHLVRNNYFQDIGGSDLTSAVVIQKGDPNWPATDDGSTYEVANNAKIFHNTFVNCNQPVCLGRNSVGTGALDPTGVQVLDNVVQSTSSNGAVFSILYDSSTITFGGDYVYHPTGNYGVTGLPGVNYGPVTPDLNPDATLGYSIPSATSPVLNIAASTNPVTSLDIRGLARPVSGKDTGSYEREVTGTGVGRLTATDVGPSYYNGPAGTFIPPGSVTAAPTFNPAGGTYTAMQSVAITSATSGAAVRYTTDGSTPSQTNGTVYTTRVAISATTTLKAIAYATGYSNSAVTSATYTLQASAPVFSPGAGTYTSAQSVAISSTTSGASIRYTTDGSTPTTTTGTLYTGMISIGATTALKAIAYAAGYTASTVSSGTYTINLPIAAAPVFSPGGGAYTGAQSVTITTATGGASIRYTIDGSTPTATTGTLYSGPVTVGSTTTLKAIAYGSGLSNSTVTSATYTISDGSVTIAVADGFYNASLSAAQTGAFTVQFDATPSISPSNATVGLCLGAQSAYTGLATAVRFNTSGTIDARNGGVYAAASSIPFSAGVKYYFRLTVDVRSHTYSIYVAPAGGSELTIGTSYAFRTEQNMVTSLDTYNIDVNSTPGGTLKVSPLTISAASQVAAPAISPSGGTFTSAQTVTIASATSGATIRYTTNGSTPSQTNGTVYTAAVAISATTTLKAIAYKTLMADSAVTTAIYTINSPAKFAIPSTSVTASADDGNVPANTVDGSLTTRWSAQGDGQWIRYDLGATKTATWVRIAFLNGDTRVSTFDVQLSTDGSTWSTVFSGSNSGTTLALETYNFSNTAARYARIIGHGNSVNTWNSITETEVWGY